MDAAAELGRNPVSKHQVQPEYGDEQADAGRTAEPVSRDQFSGVNADREIYIFPVQLTTSRIGNLTRSIHTLTICVTMQTYTRPGSHTQFPNNCLSFERRRLAYVKSSANQSIKVLKIDFQSWKGFPQRLVFWGKAEI